MKKVLCLSAPPGAGKDTAAFAICEALKNVRHKKYAKILKERTHALYGCSHLPYDYFEGEVKDKPCNFFMGITPRQAYINTSELLMKPVHGNTVWSDMLIEEIRNDNEFENFVISDCGFQTEWDELQDCEDIKSGIIEISRSGCDYSIDSRGQLSIAPNVVHYWSIPNRSDINYFKTTVISIAELFFGSD